MQELENIFSIKPINTSQTVSTTIMTTEDEPLRTAVHSNDEVWKDKLLLSLSLLWTDLFKSSKSTSLRLSADILPCFGALTPSYSSFSEVFFLLIFRRLTFCDN